MPLKQEGALFEPKTIPEGFPWVPPEQRSSRFGGSMPPRKPETRRPALWLNRRGEELYLVNALDEPLDEVSVGGERGQTLEGDVLAQSVPVMTYHHVAPGAAVKVDEYDGFYDLDYLIILNLIVRAASLAEVCFNAAGKGGIEETVLLWGNGDVGKGVFLDRKL